MSSSSSSSSPSPSSIVRTWRTSFLTLRDETLTSPSPATLLALLRRLVLARPAEYLAAAAAHLPSHEATSDLILLVGLVSDAAVCPGSSDAFLDACHLIHDVSCTIRLDVNSTSWIILLDFLDKVVDYIASASEKKKFLLTDPIGMKSIVEITDILRSLVKLYGKSSSMSESSQLIKLLLRVVSSVPTEFLILYQSNVPSSTAMDLEAINTTCQSILEVHLFALNVMGETFSRLGSSISVDLWQCTIEALRKQLDLIASKNFLIEGYAMSRFYTSLLHCLHLVLSEPKGSISEHVAGIVAALQMFFTYGLTRRSPSLNSCINFKTKAFSCPSPKSDVANAAERLVDPYRPPHLRKKGGNSTQTPIAQRLVGDDTIKSGFTSSDSEQSDTDGFTKDNDHFRTSKARVAAIVCIQDLCKADPKSLASLWSMLLPTNGVMQPRKYQATVMTCILFDPVIKARLASASALASILDGHSTTFMQVAEYKESVKCGSFTTLSSSLGQILMELHKGFLYIVQNETHSLLMAASFKTLSLLISATPYSRMPGDLLPSIVDSLRWWIIESRDAKGDQINTMASAFDCLRSALSTSPPSLRISLMLEEEISSGLFLAQGQRSTLHCLCKFSEQNVHPAIRLEAFQALQGLLHNYPTIVNGLWEHISAIVLGSLQRFISDDSSSEVLTHMRNRENINTTGSYNERCMAAAVKVLDECLRASSGFQGTDDHLETRLHDTQFLQDLTRKKKVSSAPSYALVDSKFSNETLSRFPFGSNRWSQIIEKHLPLSLAHRSPMIRAASVTCFAGLTSSVFLSITDDRQKFIISATIAAAENDTVPLVRSAACRALGVISCFPQILRSTKILDEFIHAAELNTHDSLVSVRITASWAIANICDLLRHRVADLQLGISPDQRASSRCVAHLVECALRLTKDSDKVKANAVRALGNLSRFVSFSDESVTNCEVREASGSYMSEGTKMEVNHTLILESALTRKYIDGPFWLQRMVQAFVSCVTTGNVKVQWNVCHALRNLFLNETLKLRDMCWASSVYSILLLLLRDSTNFKIRIHAAMALAVPSSGADYGNSFPDIVQGLMLVLESLWSSDQVLAPLNLKYKDALKEQLTLTTLHVIGFARSRDDEILKKFLIKKSNFLEEWLKAVCSPCSTNLDKLKYEADLVADTEKYAIYGFKNVLIYEAINSLIEVYKGSCNPKISLRFEKLLHDFP